MAGVNTKVGFECVLWCVLLAALWVRTSGQDVETCNNDNYMGVYGEGIIASDNFPFDYRNALTSSYMRKCRHRIYFDHDPSNIDRTVCFTFHRFDLEDTQDCVNDYLEFPDPEGSGHIKYCGEGKWNRGNEVRIYSNVFSPEFCFPATTSVFEVNFRADTQANGTGYYATFQINEQPSMETNSSKLQKHENMKAIKPKQDDVRKKPEETTVNSLNNDPENVTESTDLRPRNKGDLPLGEGRSRRAAEGLQCDFDPTKCTQYCFHGHVEIDGCKICDCIEGTTAPCPAGDYVCFNRKCIPWNHRCDGVDQCGDNSDEDYTHARCQGQQGIEACTFDEESSFLCKYINLQGWTRNNTSLVGPRYDHTYGVYHVGHFVYTSAYKYEDLKAQLTYPIPVHKATDHCYSFWFYMSGYVGTLRLYVNRNGGDTGREDDVVPPVWVREGNYNPRWLQGQIHLPAHVFPVTMMFEYEEKAMSEHNVALDDLNLMEGPCWGSDYSCLFEIDLCGWENDMTKAQVEWIRHFGETGSQDTGPSTDRRGNPVGYYLYMDSTDHNPGDRAVLVSRPLPNGNNEFFCLTFWVHMYGSNVGNLSVYALLSDGARRQLLWSVAGSKGDRWIYTVRTIDNVNGPYKVMFEATVGNDFKSDIAIDDIILTRGVCTNNIEPSTTPGTTSTGGPPTTCQPDFFQCDVMKCIQKNWVCDGSADCSDRSDEENCHSPLLDTGVIVGICIALLFTIVIIVLGLFFAHHRRKLMRRAPPPNHVTIDPSLYYDPTEDDIRIHGYSGDHPPPYNLIMDNPAYMGPATQLPEYSSVPKQPPPYQAKVTAKGDKHRPCVQSQVNGTPKNASLVGYGAQGVVGNLPMAPGCNPMTQTLTISLVNQGVGSGQESPPGYHISIIPTTNASREQLRSENRMVGGYPGNQHQSLEQDLPPNYSRHVDLDVNHSQTAPNQNQPPGHRNTDQSIDSNNEQHIYDTPTRHPRLPEHSNTNTPGHPRLPEHSDLNTFPTNNEKTVEPSPSGNQTTEPQTTSGAVRKKKRKKSKRGNRPNLDGATNTIDNNAIRSNAVDGMNSYCADHTNSSTDDGGFTSNTRIRNKPHHHSRNELNSNTNKPTSNPTYGMASSIASRGPHNASCDMTPQRNQPHRENTPYHYHNPVYDAIDHAGSGEVSIPRCDSYRNINPYCLNSAADGSETTV